MNLIFLLMLILVPTTLGVTIAITGLRNDMGLRRGTPYQQRGPRLHGDGRTLLQASHSSS